MKILTGIALYALGWYIGYSKGYKKNKIYKNIFENEKLKQQI